jgi:outer membrane biosynthesis protein TonB
MPTAGGSTGKASDAPIKISKTGRPGAAALPKPILGKEGPGAGSSGLGMNPSVGIKIGGQSYAGPTGKSAAGKRKIEGAVIGTPSLKAPKTEQGLTNAEVMKVVNAALSKIQQCYERELFNDPNLAGRVEYEWEINPSGSVIDVSVKRAEMSKADKLNSCVMGVIKALKFPTAKNGQNTLATIGFPFGKQ